MALHLTEREYLDLLKKSGKLPKSEPEQPKPEPEPIKTKGHADTLAQELRPILYLRAIGNMLTTPAAWLILAILISAIAENIMIIAPLYIVYACISWISSYYDKTLTTTKSIITVLTIILAGYLWYL